MARNKTPSKTKKSTGGKARRSTPDETSPPSGGDPKDRNSQCKRGPADEALIRKESLAAGLYLVATPIGNLRDITLRALDTLRAADIIACEDTRRTRPLLTHFGITGTLVAYHDHNEETAAQRLVTRMQEGLSVALVSDAGTPLISDPGFGLVAATRAAGLPVTAIPGPSAPLLALQLSGLASDRFCFAGFPPTRQGARKTAFADLAGIPASLIFFESPRRLADSLADMAAVFGPRPACVARELTKLHEEVRTGPLPDLAGLYDQQGPPKGEVVIVVDAPGESEPISPENLDALLQAALADQPVRDAAAGVALVTGLSRKEVYERALILTGKKRAPQT